MIHDLNVRQGEAPKVRRRETPSGLLPEPWCIRDQGRLHFQHLKTSVLTADVVPPGCTMAGTTTWVCTDHGRVLMLAWDWDLRVSRVLPSLADPMSLTSNVAPFELDAATGERRWLGRLECLAFLAMELAGLDWEVQVLAAARAFS